MIVLRFLMNLGVFLVPAGVAALASFMLARRSRDEWQLLAWVPVLPLAGWALFIAWGVTRDPTSHNLWPFELAFWGLVSLALLGLFVLARKVSGKPRDDWATRRDRGGTTRR
jgi:uncharacterized membrane protein HdeD (DUF308 family)